MSKAITKEYLIRQLQNFDDIVLEDKYLQKVDEAIKIVKVNNTALVPDANKAVNIEIPAAAEYTITQQAQAETGYLATYTLEKDGVQTGAKINIPKDFLVKSVSLNTVTVDDEPVEGYVVGDKYIDFVVNTLEGDGQATHLYLLVTDLIDVYTEGNGIDITSNAISVVAKTNGGLAVDASGVYIDFEDTDIDFTHWDDLSV